MTGAARITQNLQRLAQQMPAELRAALQVELEIEATEAKRRTPVDTGALRASYVVETQTTGKDVSGTITVGGPSAPYALLVHENLEAFHPVGEAKFLESTLNESRPHLAGRIARRVDVERLVN